MRLIYIIYLLLLFQNNFATTFYISTKGSDTNGNGSISNPWHSLYKATSSVTTTGDIIHIVSGTYVEASRSFLAPGVSIEGEGESTIIRSTLTEDFVAIIIAKSNEGTNGNQHISNLKLDGSNRTTSWAIEIRGRSNFTVNNCTILDFDDTGIFWGGRNDNNEAEPDTYATGNAFYNNIVTNCAKYDNYGRGCLSIGGQKEMLIYGNTITQTGRAKGTNGWPIKYANGGYLKGLKIFNNNIIKEAYDGITWDFAIELFNESGLEIYNNIIIGSIDLNHQKKGDYLHSVYIHDNIVGPKMMQQKFENGIILEFETEYALIENNQLKNLGVVVYFTPRSGDIISNFIFRNNTCYNIGTANKKNKGFALRIGTETSDEYSYSIDKMIIENNKFNASIVEKPNWGIALLGMSYANNIQVKKNSFKNFSAGYLIANNATNIDSIADEENDIYNCGNFNKPSFYLGEPKYYVSKKNIKKSSSSFSLIDFKMNIVRPIYYELKKINLLELIAIFAFFIALLLTRKENIYAFPTAFVSVTIYSLLNIEAVSILGILISFYYISLVLYGWKLWLKRDTKKHRIIRIRSSSTYQIKLAFLIFLLFFTLITSISFWLNAEHNLSLLHLLNSFTISSGFTAAYLLVKKKVETWYWWITTAISAFIVYFMHHQLIISIFCCLLFMISIICLNKWNKRKLSNKK